MPRLMQVARPVRLEAEESLFPPPPGALAVMNCARSFDVGGDQLALSARLRAIPKVAAANVGGRAAPRSVRYARVGISNLAAMWAELFSDASWSSTRTRPRQHHRRPSVSRTSSRGRRTHAPRRRQQPEPVDLGAAFGAIDWSARGGAVMRRHRLGPALGSDKGSGREIAPGVLDLQDLPARQKLVIAGSPERACGKPWLPR